MKINLEKLSKFLCEANKFGYAGSSKEVKPQRKGFTELEYKSGDWYFRDSYAGHYFAPGQEVVYYKNKPVWAMAYAGGMKFKYHGDKNLDGQIFEFLKKALLAMDPKKPFRGPAQFKEKDWVYKSSVKGDVRDFSGNEKISRKGQVVFEQNFIGGLIVEK